MTLVDRHTTRIVVTGFRPSIRDLCDDLARQPGVELVGAAGRIAEAAWAFNAQAIDVVVHAALPGPLPRADLQDLRQYTQAPIVLLVEQAGPTLLEDAVDADVADVVLLPEPAEHVAFAVRKARRRSPGESSQRARIITSFSPKGGTGKTVVATNLAAALAKQDGARTLLLDLDLQFGDAAIMLGVDPQRTLHDLVTAPGELDVEKVGGYLTKHGASGLDLLPAPLRPEESDLVSVQKVERLFEVTAPAYDAVVVDTSPSFHGPMLSALDRTDVLLLICTPEVPTLKNVRLGIDTLRKLGFPEDRLKILLNRSDARGSIGRREVETALGVPVSYELPVAPEVPVAVNDGKPLAIASPANAFAVAVRELAHSVLGASRGDERDEAERAGLRGALAAATAWLPSRGGNTQPSAQEPA